jgi:hypothetical protein
MGEAGVPFIEHGGRVIAAAHEACGCDVMFGKAGAR